MNDHETTLHLVGIRKIKAHFGEYLRRAAGGETVIITDRGKPVVELRVIDPELAGILALIASGQASWSGGRPQGARGIRIKGGPISQTISDMREEDARKFD